MWDDSLCPEVFGSKSRIGCRNTSEVVACLFVELLHMKWYCGCGKSLDEESPQYLICRVM